MPAANVNVNVHCFGRGRPDNNFTASIQFFRCRHRVREPSNRIGLERSLMQHGSVMYIFSSKSEESVIIEGINNPEREVKVTVLEVMCGRVNLAFEVDPVVPSCIRMPTFRSAAASGAAMRRQSTRCSARNGALTYRPRDWSGRIFPFAFREPGDSGGREGEVIME